MRGFFFLIILFVFLIHLRIHNLKLYATAAIPKIFKGADLDAVLNCLIRKAVAQIPKDNLKSCRTQFLKNVTDILAAYRAHVFTPFTLDVSFSFFLVRRQILKYGTAYSSRGTQIFAYLFSWCT